MLMSENTKDVKEILKNSGYKFTWQRELVYNIFKDHRDLHMTTEEVYRYVSEKNSDIGIATVYRTVQLFHKLDILDQIIFDDNIIRYELRVPTSGHRHHHLICLSCGKVIEVKADYLEEIEKRIEEDEDFTITDHTLKFIGYCKDCHDTIKE